MASNQEKPSATHSPLYVPATPIDPAGTLSITLQDGDPSIRNAENLPVPPHEQMEYRENSERHLFAGKRDVGILRSTLEDLNFELSKAGRILEFGCANARLLRWFVDLADHCDLYGVDIQSDKISWCMENLHPWFNFSVCSTIPHLPYRDGFIDLTYAGSVFTHLGELHSEWFLELARITKPGGYLYLTFIDERSLDLLESELQDDPMAKRVEVHGQRQIIRDRKFDWISIGAYGDHFLSQVFMTERYIKYLCRSVAEIVEIVPGAFSRFQTGYVFRVK